MNNEEFLKEVGDIMAAHDLKRLDHWNTTAGRWVSGFIAFVITGMSSIVVGSPLVLVFALIPLWYALYLFAMIVIRNNEDPDRGITRNPNNGNLWTHGAWEPRQVMWSMKYALKKQRKAIEASVKFSRDATKVTAALEKLV